ATMTASAESDNVFEWTAFGRHWGWGEWPQEVTYTDGGQFTIEDTGRFTRQYQLYYPITAQEDKDAILDMIKTACSDYEGNLKVDVTVFNNANTNWDKIEENSSVNCHITLAFKAKDMDENLDDDDRIITDKWNAQGWFSPDGQSRPLVLSVDDYDSWYSDPEYYQDFEVIGFYLNFMNYACNAVKDDPIEYEGITVKPGTGGLGFTKLSYSALYIDGADTPAVGNDIGKGYEFVPNENREQVENPKNGRLLDKYPGTFIIDGKSYLQLDDGTQIDGPLGNGADMVRVPVDPQPTDPQPTDPQPTDPQPTDPQPTDPQPTDPQPTDPQPTDPQPTDPQPTDPQPTDPPTTGVVYGDANEDGNVNMLDVLLIRKYIAKQPVTPNLVNSDVTHDGNVNMIDVLKIRKFIAKQPVDLSRPGNV
ncbi:MAG: dockerin type I repeat-containing protein, partial [Acutalibacteraceae bacterium]